MGNFRPNFPYLAQYKLRILAGTCNSHEEKDFDNIFLRIWHNTSCGFVSALATHNEEKDFYNIVLGYTRAY